MNLIDPFDTVHKKPLKNKQGVVVAELDYVGWSQVADRLDEAAPGWSFNVVQLHEDWCLGRLTFADGRIFENVGYAENADADWKKEALKDAVSDALKRCAALAGVARYLYDKDRPQSKPTNGHQRPVEPRRAAPQESVVISATPRPTVVPDAPEVDDEEWAGLISGRNGSVAVAVGQCPVHHKPWKTVPAGVSKKTGKSFSAFQACPEFGCNEKPR